jgi:hypothetical protein
MSLDDPRNRENNKPAMHKAGCQTAKVTDYQEGNLSTNTIPQLGKKFTAFCIN